MTQTLRPLPNDGPALRWALEHATRYIINLGDRQSFADEICQYRHARDGHSNLRESTNVPIRIDGLGGNIEMSLDYGGGRFIIWLPGVSIEERLEYVASADQPPNKNLTLHANGDVPLAMAEALIGQPVTALIQLPAPLQPLIKDRTILSLECKPPNIHATLSSPD